MIEYCYQIFKRFLIPGSILELGPAEGLMTKYLIFNSQDITLVDGSEIFCKELSDKYPEANIVSTLFEDFNPKRKFDNILLGHVLEHVEDPVVILKLVRTWLSEKGRILAAVPNSRSLHRQAAVLMNMLETEDSMSELDFHHGHRRIYNPESFRNEFKKAGLKLEHLGAIG